MLISSVMWYPVCRYFLPCSTKENCIYATLQSGKLKLGAFKTDLLIQLILTGKFQLNRIIWFQDGVLSNLQLLLVKMTKFSRKQQAQFNAFERFLLLWNSTHVTRSHQMPVLKNLKKKSLRIKCHFYYYILKCCIKLWNLILVK